MEIFAKQFICGNFNASDYGLIASSFDYKTESDDDTGLHITTIEEFTGHNPVPLYLGDKYDQKLVFTITFIKNPCMFDENILYFSEKDCRNVLRTLTGMRGYQWTKIVQNDLDDDIWYYAKPVNVSYKRIGSKVEGIIIDFECDSFFAWSKENLITVNAKANIPFYIYNNTDDLLNYVLPTVTIKCSNTGTFQLNNQTESWFSIIENVTSNEVITINSKNKLISSSIVHNLLLDDFNLNWIRLVPDKNTYVANQDCLITFKYRVPRKVGLA